MHPPPPHPPFYTPCHPPLPWCVPSCIPRRPCPSACLHKRHTPDTPLPCVLPSLPAGCLQIVFFVLGCCYGSNTFFHAAKIYVEAYHMVPKGTCRLLVKFMAWCFFTSWIMFPLLFLMGPEGFGHLSPYASVIAHTFADVLSKNLWGLLGHHLRVKVGWGKGRGLGWWRGRGRLCVRIGGGGVEGAQQGWPACHFHSCIASCTVACIPCCCTDSCTAKLVCTPAYLWSLLALTYSQPTHPPHLVTPTTDPRAHPGARRHPREDQGEGGR